MPRGPRLTEEERENRRAEVQRKREDLSEQLVLTKDYISPKRWEELSRIAVRRIQERQFGADEEGMPGEEVDEDGHYGKKRKGDSDEEDDEEEEEEEDDEVDANGMKKKDGKKSNKKSVKKVRKVM
ncbi:Hypothetical Protein FCC1311_016642 [Hondaea fermentalgiana]|uniref:OmpA-like domain-containing protein n=1 Tax=Hondaea fermentalgiana TaxID=2315210 RepID=A0A2R5G337_9STRA|nr:Hypothetical Protein FCC1311_016642 [Hondaea fermentalgiana]|eukprot:GBG25446.1 Hypothetical Protein FCC1311_016642 [Hondaea fermentalgiana]